ncbi:hypothetical protein Dsin_032739 [Dipteronia sinensis]|uniref:RNase H type-1 domain-containing protein n=1 Tax=Dipteronia sinensis TaxID=43782 RepID=A0AAD9ZBY2_9ROSI|nr:hypothetical protein Dsin_032739 [Dipteronia sinensis]
MNQLVFEGKSLSVEQAKDNVKFKVTWWFKYHEKESKDTITSLLLNIKELCIDDRTGKHIKNDKWTPPAFNNLKFNIDGSAKGKPGLAGIGGVLRDHKGRVLCSFSLSIGLQKSNTAKIRAIQKAYALCVGNSSLSGRNIKVDSDSKVAVSWINNGGYGSIKHVNTI